MAGWQCSCGAQESFNPQTIVSVSVPHKVTCPRHGEDLKVEWNAAVKNELKAELREAAENMQQVVVDFDPRIMVIPEKFARQIGRKIRKRLRMMNKEKKRKERGE